MNKITLFRHGGSWIARFDGQHAYEIIALMGTADIPTAYTDQAEAGVVAEAIAALNPGVTVVTQ